MWCTDFSRMYEATKCQIFHFVPQENVILPTPVSEQDCVIYEMKFYWKIFECLAFLRFL